MIGRGNVYDPPTPPPKKKKKPTPTPTHPQPQPHTPPPHPHTYTRPPPQKKILVNSNVISTTQPFDGLRERYKINKTVVYNRLFFHE